MGSAQHFLCAHKQFPSFVTAAIGGIVCAVYGLFLFWLAGIIRVLTLIVDPWLNWLGIVLIPALGIVFIAIGALALCKIPALQNVAIHHPLPSLNILWEVGIFMYGIWWLEMYAEIERRSSHVGKGS